MKSTSRKLLTVDVVGRDLIARDVVQLRVQLADGADLPSWAPGAHVDVYLPGMLRHYSLCGDPEDLTSYEFAVLFEPAGRGGSRYVHEQVQVGSQLQIARPRNHFALVDAPGYVFVAGGIGITPIRAMVSACERSGKPWVLYYGGRHEDSMAYFDEFSKLSSARLLPQDIHGLLNLSAILAEAPDEFAVYCCGPERLLHAIEEAALAVGRIVHVERFAPAEAKHQFSDRPVTVVCAESGQTVEVGAQVTVLDALIAAGVDVNYDCRDGTCGTCELEVVEGDPEHRDAILSLRDRLSGRVMYPCVSRARGDRLILDV